MKNTQKGFTILELLVVIAIVGVLAAIVITLMNNSRNKTRDTKVVTQLKSMIAQAQLYTGSYTGSNQLIYWQSVIPQGGVPDGGSVVVAGIPFYSNLFTNSTDSTNSLYRLASSLPTGTVLYFSAEAKSPSTGGRWAFAASTSAGSFCVDYMSNMITKNVVLTPQNKATQYPKLDYYIGAPATDSFLCT